MAKTSCEACGSSDAREVYEDGHSYCFSCGSYFKADGEAPKDKAGGKKLVNGVTVKALKSRNLQEDTCKLYGYGVAKYNGKPCQVATLRDAKGRRTGQKLRFKNKDFLFIGDSKPKTLFGRHLCRDSGKMIVVTEGEIDAMSVTQVMGKQYPAVSVPQGAKDAAKSIKANLEWLSKFDKVVLAFDADEDGRVAAEECAQVLPPGKAHIVNWPEDTKDANDLLKSRRYKELTNAVWGASQWRPDEIVAGEDLWDLVLTPPSAGLELPYPVLNEMTLGARAGEIVTVCAGSGIGKSEFVRQIAYKFAQRGEKVGYIALEESVRRTVLGLMGLHMDRRLHMEDVTKLDRQDLHKAFTETVSKFVLYDHFGSLAVDNLVARVRYMARALDVRWIVLDHVSIVISGTEDGDERRMLDNVMTALRSLAEEAGVGIFVVSHLKRPKDGSYNEGRKVSLTDLRGSAALEQLSDTVIGLERNQQDEANADLTTVRLLKCRWTGKTGRADFLRYDHETGWMNPCDGPQSEFEEEDPY